MFCQTAPIQVPERIASQPFDIAGPGARLVVIEPVRGASESALAATPRALELLEALRGELAPREELGGQRLLRPPTTTLSQREWEIVQKLMACHRLTEVSKDLGISIHTARNHLKSVFRKLGVRSQSELVQAILSGRA
ncbi:MAG: helix-turn-helix transcriptional regulator [Vicinamibacterales bacterium]